MIDLPRDEAFVHIICVSLRFANLCRDVHRDPPNPLHSYGSYALQPPILSSIMTYGRRSECARRIIKSPSLSRCINRSGRHSGRAQDYIVTATPSNPPQPVPVAGFSKVFELTTTSNHSNGGHHGVVTCARERPHESRRKLPHILCGHVLVMSSNSTSEPPWCGEKLSKVQIMM